MMVNFVYVENNGNVHRETKLANEGMCRLIF